MLEVGCKKSRNVLSGSHDGTLSLSMWSGISITADVSMWPGCHPHNASEGFSSSEVPAQILRGVREHVEDRFATRSCLKGREFNERKHLG
jgi:hypothetical protein